MVNVPGRSKGCETCRQRRIACSLEKPHCFRCIKSNRLCPGYQRNRVFVAFQGDKSQNGKCDQKPGIPQTHSRSSTGFQEKTYGSLQLENSPAFTGLSTEYISLQESVQHCTALINTASRKQLLSAFVGGQIDAAQARADEDIPWIMVVPGLANPTKAIDVAALALCSVRLGRDSNNDVLIHQGLHLYTQGLKELQIALWDPQSMYRDETLGAAMLLSMYEIFECPGKSHLAYEEHSSGCAKLVQLRGPEAHRSGFGHELFRGFRIQGILQGLRFHRTSFLNEQVWRDVPFEASGKSQFDKIIDFFARLPGIWERADVLQTLKSAQLLTAAMGILEDCWAIVDELDEFCEEFAKSRPAPMYWPMLSTEDNPADDPVHGKVFPTALHFIDMSTARILLMYWAAELMLEAGLWLLYQYIPTMVVANEQLVTCGTEEECGILCSCKFHQQVPGVSQLDMALLRPLGQRGDFFKTAVKICQSFEYCMNSAMLTMGPPAIGPALVIAIQNLKLLPAHTRELAWAQASFEKVKQRGVKILDYIQFKT